MDKDKSVSEALPKYDPIADRAPEFRKITELSNPRSWSAFVTVSVVSMLGTGLF